MSSLWLWTEYTKPENEKFMIYSKTLHSTLDNWSFIYTDLLILILVHLVIIKFIIVYH